MCKRRPGALVLHAEGAPEQQPDPGAQVLPEQERGARQAGDQREQVQTGLEASHSLVLFELEGVGERLDLLGVRNGVDGTDEGDRPLIVGPGQGIGQAILAGR